MYRKNDLLKGYLNLHFCREDQTHCKPRWIRRLGQTAAWHTVAPEPSWNVRGIAWPKQRDSEIKQQYIINEENNHSWIVLWLELNFYENVQEKHLLSIKKKKYCLYLFSWNNSIFYILKELLRAIYYCIYSLSNLSLLI